MREPIFYRKFIVAEFTYNEKNELLRDKDNNAILKEGTNAYTDFIFEGWIRKFNSTGKACIELSNGRFEIINIEHILRKVNETKK